MKQQNILLAILGGLIAYALFREGGSIMSTGQNLIEKMADAIQKFEGWFSGSVSQRNNNPGNLRYFGGEKWQGQVGVDLRQFIIFDTYENGRRALEISLRNAATGISRVYSPSMSFLDFFNKYAPSSDSNYPDQYAAYVAREIGVNVNDPISVIV